jgi:hypothetical protein
MAGYSFYQLAEMQKIVAGYFLDCPCDRAALSAACRLADHALPVEVWQQTRRVGRVYTAPWLRETWLEAEPTDHDEAAQDEPAPASSTTPSSGGRCASARGVGRPGSGWRQALP